MDRGEHSIDDELVFSNHEGYVFHDSRGIESGSTEELGILQGFIRRKCQEWRLQDRLHAIWYCVPMDNQRPQLDLKFSKDICSDQNVPVIVVFTKYDQFLRNVEMHVVDYPNEYLDITGNVSEVAEKQYQEHYLRPLGDDVRYVRLQKLHMKNRRCDDLIEKTAAALNDETVALMLLAVQRGNLKSSVLRALNRVHSSTGLDVKHTKTRSIVWECLSQFPYIWFFSEGYSNGFEEFRFSKSAKLRLFLFYLSPRAFFKLSEIFTHFTTRVMLLPTIQNLTTTGHSRGHLILAVILILKHATFLRLSKLSRVSALTHAELDYQEANIDLNVQQHLSASSQEHSVGQDADFIMATEIVLSPKTRTKCIQKRSLI